MNRAALRNSSILLVLLFSLSALEAKEYRDYFQKGERNWKTILYIYERYPIMPVKKEQARELYGQWDEIKVHVVQSRKEMRAHYLKKLKEAYSQSNETLRDISIEMAAYVKFLREKFWEQMTPQTPAGAHNLEQRWKLAEQEMKRAKAAYFQKDYHYSARLYEQAASIMISIYESFGFALPSR